MSKIVRKRPNKCNSNRLMKQQFRKVQQRAMELFRQRNKLNHKWMTWRNRKIKISLRMKFMGKDKLINILFSIQRVPNQIKMIRIYQIHQKMHWPIILIRIMQIHNSNQWCHSSQYLCNNSQYNNYNRCNNWISLKNRSLVSSTSTDFVWMAARNACFTIPSLQKFKLILMGHKYWRRHQELMRCLLK